jgi:hypothetical protein
MLVDVDGGRKYGGDTSVANSLSSDLSNTVGKAGEGETA